ncbi:rhodopsin-like [Littorina saxatilis]|uniref:rhodopsin-like n=1 Tax=Littorina saxatilis TaxID=31220 RepID=UPI0038B5B251
MPKMSEEPLHVFQQTLNTSLDTENNTSAKLARASRMWTDLQHPRWRDLDPTPTWQHCIIGVYMLLLAAIAVTGNVIVVWACVRNVVMHSLFLDSCRFRSLRTSSNLLVVNLAVGDLLMCAVDFPLFVAASFLQGWPFGKTICQAYGFLTAAAGLVTINTLAVISFDRYRSVSRRLNPCHSRPTRATLGAAVSVWLYSIPWALAPALGWGQYVLDGIGTTCTFDFFTRTVNNVSFVMSVTVGNFALPLLVILFSYSGIWLVVRGTRVTLKSQGDVTVSLGTRRQRLGFQSDLRTAVIILIILSTFLVSWLPYLVVCFLGLFGQESLVTAQVSATASLVAKTSTALNPVLYSISHPKVRRKVRLMLGTFLPTKLMERRPTRSSSLSNGGLSGRNGYTKHGGGNSKL